MNSKTIVHVNKSSQDHRLDVFNNVPPPIASKPGLIKLDAFERSQDVSVEAEG
jgi:hypothetical protein